MAPGRPRPRKDSVSARVELAGQVSRRRVRERSELKGRRPRFAWAEVRAAARPQGRRERGGRSEGRDGAGPRAGFFCGRAACAPEPGT